MNLTFERLLRAHAVYDRIVEHYGRSPHHDWRPPLYVIHDPRFLWQRKRRKPRFGSYGWEIVVNFARCRTWADVVGTLVHEVQHHHQDPERKDTKAYEAEADAVVARDLHLFMDERRKAA